MINAPDVNKISDILYDAVGMKTNDLARHLFIKIVQKNPVLTGRSRASWRIGIGAPDTSSEPESSWPEPSDSAASAAYNHARGQLGRLSQGSFGGAPETIYITNSLDYVLGLESGAGSRKSPQGMVGVSIQEIMSGF